MAQRTRRGSSQRPGHSLTMARMFSIKDLGRSFRAGGFLALLGFLLAARHVRAESDWPRFRGPNGSGIPEQEVELPVKFGPSENVVWQTEIPPGMSSPVVAGGRIYLTALRDKDLWTLAIDPSGGRVLWEEKAPAKGIEEVHSTSSPAASTPATDGERVIAFFGSYGLLAYDRDGKELWTLPLGPFKNPYGAASSPVISGGLVLLNIDQDDGSFLLAVEKETGKVRYRVDRPGFPRGFSTPVIWERGGRREVLVAGTLRLVGYSADDGRELWSHHGLARIVNATPVVGDGKLFVSSFAPGGDSGDRIAMPSFEEYAKRHDADGDGRFTDPEIPAGEMKVRFRQIDTDKDGFITRAEWESMAAIFAKAMNGLLALSPDGTEARDGVKLAWKYEKAIPYVPTVLYYRGHTFMVKDGGIFTVIDAASGKLVKQGRLAAGGSYYSSPVASGGRMYVISLEGEATVLSAAPECQVLATNPLRERCAATPAIAGGRLYVRTEGRLYAFAMKGTKSGG